MATRCRTCARTIFFAVSEATGNLVPMDLAPTVDGQFVPVRDEQGEVARNSAGLPLVRWLTNAQAFEHRGQRWSSHFATCPSAAVHRRRRASR